MQTPLTELTEQERALAWERYQVLRPFVEEGVPLGQVAQQHSQTLRTLRRWVARYRAEGLAGLARKERADQGERRKLSPEMQKLVEGLALQKPPLSAALIHLKGSDLAQLRGESVPSYSLVYGVISDLPRALTTLAHQGSKAYSQTFDLVHRREASGPNVIWQADHTELDIVLLREGQEPDRPWLTTIIDDYSRAIAGYYLSFEAPCALHTSLALRQAIWRKENPHWHLCGIPQILYSDNGSDFTSHHLEQVSVDLKIRLQHSLPGQPRGRGRIERFFGTLNQMLLSDLPGYTPSKGSERGKPQLTLPAFETQFLKFLLDLYHVREHGDTKMPPQARWEAGGFLPQMPESLEQLDLLLLTVPKGRKVRSDGIWFLGMRYIDPTLASYVGEDVVLRYDPRDIAEVRVFYQNRFLCRAICQELAGETVPLREILRARNHRRKELRQTLQDRQRTVDTLLELRRWTPTPPEETATAQPTVEPAPPPLKRYFNE
jgi:putative transposase